MFCALTGLHRCPAVGQKSHSVQYDPTLCSGCSSGFGSREGGPSLHLGASCRTNNAGEVSAVAVAYLKIDFLRSLPECTGLPATVRIDSLTTVQLVQLQARASGNADLVRNAAGESSEHRVAAHFFSHRGLVERGG